MRLLYQVYSRSLEQLEGVWHSDVSVDDKTVKIMYEISKIDIKN